MECWAYSPLVQGSYDRADRPFPDVYDHPGTTARLAALAEVAEAHGAKPGQVVLSWLVQSEPSLRPIVGVSSLEQLDEARQIAEIVSVQRRFNVMDRSAGDMLEVCERDGLAFIPWAPVAQGGLDAAHRALADVAHTHNTTINQTTIT